MKDRIWHIARIVVESTTPLSITTGSADGAFDTALVTDANGLPALPGSSLAGVLRHLWVDIHGESAADEVFGFQAKHEGQRSRLNVSWGALLDSHGHPVEGLLLGADRLRLSEDPVLAAAASLADTPQTRQRVRLTHRGAASVHGKFDRAVLPTGHRFAVELLYCCDDPEDGHWQRLLNLFDHPGLRLGGATRGGLGRLALRSAHAGVFDLADHEQRQRFLALGRGLGDIKGLAPATARSQDGEWLAGTLRLEPRGLWRMGQGAAEIASGAGKQGPKKPADLLPVTEERVVWEEGRGRPGLQAVLIPGSAIKGALAHRIAFHAHRFRGSWAEPPLLDEAAISRPREVTALLGSVNNDDDDRDAGAAGCLYLDDGFLAMEAVQVAQLMHNAIDRFTGGVRNRVLFEEQSLWQGGIEITIALDLATLERRATERGTTLEQIRLGLAAALEELCDGRLAIGSRTTTGNGFCSGKVTGTFGDWLGTRWTGEAQ